MPYMYIYKTKNGIWHDPLHEHTKGFSFTEERRIGTDGQPDPPREKICQTCFPDLADKKEK